MDFGMDCVPVTTPEPAVTGWWAFYAVCACSPF